MKALPHLNGHPVRVLLADDHTMLREALATLLAAAGAEVVATAGDGASAIDLARALVPDVIVMDLRMPDIDGAEATRRILRDQPAARVIAISAHSDIIWVEKSFAAGARGYVLKDHAFNDLLEAIVAALDGRDFVSPNVMGAARFLRERQAAGAPR